MTCQKSAPLKISVPPAINNEQSLICVLTFFVQNFQYVYFRAKTDPKLVRDRSFLCQFLMSIAKPFVNALVSWQLCIPVHILGCAIDSFMGSALLLIVDYQWSHAASW